MNLSHSPCSKALILLLIFTDLQSDTTLLAQSPNVANLHFMTGSWKLTNEWGDQTEIWSDAAGNNLMCTYRCIKDNKPVFYEFIIIEQDTSGPVMKLRHFNAGSIGWEAKDSPYLYPLISLQNNKAIFENPNKNTRLIYERISDTCLMAYLDRNKDGVWKREEFKYTRAK